MRYYDITDVMAIENESFADPYEEAYFLKCISSRQRFAWVAELTEFPGSEDHPSSDPSRLRPKISSVRKNPITCVGGYILFKISGTKLEIISIACGSKSRRRKVGDKLLSLALTQGKQFGARYAKLHVSVFNLPAQNLVHPSFPKRDGSTTPLINGISFPLNSTKNMDLK